MQGGSPEAPYHVALGAALKQQGRLPEAVACYRRALELRPDFPEAWNNLGNALGLLGRLDEAADCYRRAIALAPGHPEAHNNLGNALHDQGRVPEAIALYRLAIELRPDFPEAQHNLANALQQRGELDEAIACYERAIALRPAYPEAEINRGNALQQQGRLDAAVACYRRALALRPDHPDAHINLSKALRDLGRPAEAAACGRRALALRPDDPAAHSNLALALLAQGDLAAGWPEYEWRWQTPQMAASRRGFAQPQWRGEPAAGRTLLIHAEQGFGDTLQFCRYAPLAAARGWRVVMQVQAPLVRLLRGLPGLAAVIGEDDPLPEFDLHCPMLSLPLAMGTTLETIPSAPAYLQADAAQVAAWRARLAALGDRGARIGLAWAGNPRPHVPLLTAIDRRRSIAPDRLAPLLEVPGLHFVSLQKHGPAAPAGFGLTDFMGETTDFADTAALIANLDLVIAVDTAVVHLAAALGRPVWMLDRFDTCWRWLRGRRDSPWYPTLRLYRQPTPGDWESVVAEVAGDLRGYAGR